MKNLERITEITDRLRVIGVEIDLLQQIAQHVTGKKTALHLLFNIMDLDFKPEYQDIYAEMDKMTHALIKRAYNAGMQPYPPPPELPPFNGVRQFGLKVQDEIYYRVLAMLAEERRAERLKLIGELKKITKNKKK